MESVEPVTKYLTFGPWIYMVPQYKPESVLMLGYAGGTTAGLIRLLYGDVPITAVDIVDCENKYGVKFIKTDANEFVKTCGHFDVVIVDLFPTDDYKVCDFILTREFVENIKKIANYIIVNTLKEADMSEYNKSLRSVTMIKPPRCANKIYYYGTKYMPDLFI